MLRKITKITSCILASILFVSSYTNVYALDSSDVDDSSGDMLTRITGWEVKDEIYDYQDGDIVIMNNGESDIYYFPNNLGYSSGISDYGTSFDYQQYFGSQNVSQMPEMEEYLNRLNMEEKARQTSIANYSGNTFFMTNQFYSDLQRYSSKLDHFLNEPWQGQMVIASNNEYMLGGAMRYGLSIEAITAARKQYWSTAPEPNYNDYAYLMYVVDGNGNLISDVILDYETTQFNYGSDYIVSAFGNTKPSRTTTKALGCPPIGIKRAFSKMSYDDYSEFISKLFGVGIADTVYQQNVHEKISPKKYTRSAGLIIEAIYGSDIYAMGDANEAVEKQKYTVPYLNNMVVTYNTKNNSIIAHQRELNDNFTVLANNDSIKFLDKISSNASFMDGDNVVININVNIPVTYYQLPSTRINSAGKIWATPIQWTNVYKDLMEYDFFDGTNLAAMAVIDGKAPDPKYDEALRKVYPSQMTFLKSHWGRKPMTATKHSLAEIKSGASGMIFATDYVNIGDKNDIKDADPLPGDYVIHESEASRNIDFMSQDKFADRGKSYRNTGNDIVDNIDFRWQFNQFDECPGHTAYTTTTGEDGKTVTLSSPVQCYNHRVNDQTYALNVKWTTNNKGILNPITGNNVNFTGSKSRKQLSSGAASVHGRYSGIVSSGLAFTNNAFESGVLNTSYGYNGDNDIKVAALAVRNSDNITLAAYKGESDNGSALCGAANTPEERSEDDYTNTVDIVLEEGDSVDKITEDKWDHGGGWDGWCEPDKDIAEYTPQIVSPVVSYEVWAGSEQSTADSQIRNTGDNVTESKKGSSYGMKSGVMTHTSDLEFYPYIRMSYEESDVFGAFKKDEQYANVLSTWKRELSLNSYAEVQWTRTTSDNLDLDSAQWSIHAQAVADHGAGCVLPGGAQLGILTPNEKLQHIRVVTYQPVLDGDGLKQVTASGSATNLDKLTMSYVAQAHQQYVDSVKNSIENWGIQQYQNSNNIGADPWNNAFKGAQVYEASDLSELNSGQQSQAQDDSKYYFNDKKGTESIDGSYLEVLQDLGTQTSTYSYKTDPTGKFTGADSNLSRSQGIESLGATDKFINQRVGICSNLLSAVERNTGCDYTADWAKDDGRWYNEAFDGVKIVVQTTELVVGYSNPEMRSQVLDPNLTPRQESQTDLFSKYDVGAFKTHPFIGERNNKMFGQDYIIGTFECTNVPMNNMDEFYWSRSFWIPNTTVQDLK